MPVRATISMRQRTPMTPRSSLPRERHFRSLSAHGFHRVVYYEWGAHDNPDVVSASTASAATAAISTCSAKRSRRRTACSRPDMPGRGNSEWLRDPLDYVAPTYLTTLTALICASGVDDVAWVGTSMGALLGIMAASLPGTPVKRLVVNDAGPVLDAAGARAHRPVFRDRSRVRDVRRARRPT